MSREGFRRTLREKGQLSLKAHPTRKHEGEIMHVAEKAVTTMPSTTAIYEVIKKMAERKFRRIPLANPATKRLEGIVTASDIINYLGGGEKFGIIQRKYDGNFFKAINEPIKLIMTKKVVAIKTSAKVSEALELMKERNLGGLPVVDEEDSVKAILTERDIANLFADRISGVTVAQIMSEEVITALPQTTIFEAEKTMTTQGFRRLPIVSDGKVLGIITTMDIISFFGSGEVFKYLRSGTIIQVLSTPALSIATKAVSTIAPEADAGQAAKIMHEKNVGALPVLRNGKLAGMITERDFFKLIE